MKQLTIGMNLIIILLMTATRESMMRAMVTSLACQTLALPERKEISVSDISPA